MLLTNHNKIDHKRLGPSFRGLIELDMISIMAYQESEINNYNSVHSIESTLPLLLFPPRTVELKKEVIDSNSSAEMISCNEDLLIQILIRLPAKLLSDSNLYPNTGFLSFPVINSLASTHSKIQTLAFKTSQLKKKKKKKVPFEISNLVNLIIKNYEFMLSRLYFICTMKVQATQNK